MKYRKSHFRYTSDQRNGTFYLLILIIVCQFVYYFWSNSSKEDLAIADTELLINFEKEYDSLVELQLKNDSLSIYKVNPNYINDFRGYQLGMSVEEIDRLLAFRKSGKYVNSLKEFQNITGVSDSLLQVIRPQLKLHSVSNYKKKIDRGSIEKKDINTVSADELQVVNGVGDVLSERIVKYRDKLQGFSDTKQLAEVYHLKPMVVERIWEYFEIQTLPKIELLNVNTATFKELLSIVYIDYELTKKILEYRDEVAEIQELNELQKIDGFPIEKFDRIALYLSAN